MSALVLGLVAAFAWAFHDICVRYLSQNTPLMASLLTVLIAGITFHLGVMTWQGAFHAVTGAALGYALLSGVFFLVASLGLYFAFQRGPVRLVAPIIASYPILSVAWAVLRGTSISPLQWLAIIAIVVGVSVVAALADHGPTDGEIPPKGPTIVLSLMAAVGFAGTFAISQYAAELSHEMPVTLLLRITAIVLLLGFIILRRDAFWPGKRALPMLILMGCADGIALMAIVSAATLPNAQYAAVAGSTFGLLTIVLAWAILRERMTAPQWAGCAVTFAGIGYLAL